MKKIIKILKNICLQIHPQFLLGIIIGMILIISLTAIKFKKDENQILFLENNIEEKEEIIENLKKQNFNITEINNKLVEVQNITSRSLSESRKKEENKYKEFIATAYCTESYPHICNNGDATKTATGTTPTPNRTIAVDPKVIKLGSKVEIKGYGTYIAEDTGGAIKGNKIDIVFKTHQQALNFGKKNVYLKVIE